MPLTLSDTDQADAMVGVCDLLRGRIEQLAPLWSKGAPDVRDLLNGLLDTLANAEGAAQKVVDAAELWGDLGGVDHAERRAAP